MRVFVRLRQMMVTHRVLAEKPGELEERIQNHDQQIIDIFKVIRQLMAPPMKFLSRQRWRRREEL